MAKLKNIKGEDVYARLGVGDELTFVKAGELIELPDEVLDELVFPEANWEIRKSKAEKPEAKSEETV